jgi:hypothetical protein
MLNNLEARGSRTPVSNDSHPTVSADVLLEGTRNRRGRGGLLRMAPDVITFVITCPFMASARLWGRLQSHFLVRFRTELALRVSPRSGSS